MGGAVVLGGVQTMKRDVVADPADKDLGGFGLVAKACKEPINSMPFARRYARDSPA